MFRRKQPDNTESHPGLTSDVRYALNNRNSLLNPRDIVSLFANKLGNVGFYMTMKACSGNHTLQADLLGKAASYDFDVSRFTKEDASKALGYLATQDKPFVDGQKLNPIRSLGVSAWMDKFTQTLNPILAEQPEAPLYMVANATYVGIDRVAAVSVLTGRSLGILRPSSFGEPDGQVGFMLDPGPSGVDIRSLDYDFERPEGAIIFDDTLNSGKHRDRILEFWGQDGHPSFITAFVEGGHSNAAVNLQN